MLINRLSKSRFAGKVLLLLALLSILSANLINWWLLAHNQIPQTPISIFSFTFITSVILLLITLVMRSTFYLTPKIPVNKAPPFSLSDEISGSSTSKSLLSQNDDAHAVLTSLLENPDSIEPFIHLLKNQEAICGATSSAIYIANDNVTEMGLLASTEAPGKSWPASWPYIDSGSRDAENLSLRDPECNDDYLVYIPLYHGLESHAELILKLPENIVISEQVYASLKTQSKVLADILYSTRLAQINLRNAQYEERAAIARELHDSIAQSLSYMKIQTSRLQDMLSSSDLPDKDHALMIDSVIQDLRTTMNVAYRHLRELISTFRITMGGRKFSQALVDSINEFSNRSIIAIDVDNRLPENALSVAEEIQLLHIIREGLSNVVRHSHASSARVSVLYGDDAKVRITLEDNGIGIPKKFDRERHHGIIIMQERVLALDGTIHFGKLDNGGTIISITFTGHGGQKDNTNA